MRPAIYLDYNATAPIRPAVVEAVCEAMRQTGNPSSIHAFGRSARRLVEDARGEVAALVGTKASRVIFTSGGTEANNLALRGSGRARILVSATEHDSVLGVCAEAERIPVGPDGLLDLEALDGLLEGRGAETLVSVMQANNETGVLQPIAQIVERAHERGALVHCDAVQAAGKVPLNAEELGVDFLTLSAHKLGGPQGIGALVLGKGIEVTPLLRGGGQERRRRAGTENVAAIAGFGVAATLAREGLPEMEKLAERRDAFEQRLKEAASNTRIFGAQSPRLPNTTTVTMPGVPSDTQLMVLDLEGFAVSSGSACSSGKVTSSHVLAAMGASEEEAGEAIRISTGWNSDPTDLEHFAEAWINLYRRKGKPAADSSAA